MTHNLDDLPFQLRCPSARPLVSHQQQKLDAFAEVQSEMQLLWDWCESVRKRSSKDRRRYPRDGDQFQLYVEQYEFQFLAHVPDGYRYRVAKDAIDRTVEHVAPLWERIHGFTPFAHGEIGARLLVWLALRTASEAYEHDLRLPAWHSRIRVAEAELATTCAAWRSFAAKRKPSST